MAEGQITRKDIITDDAINWGSDYAKLMDQAIGKNKEFVTAIVALNEANNKLKGSFNQTDFIESQKKAAKALDETNVKWKEQNQLELAMISTKKKVELATESTNKALIQERLQLALVNKEIKQEALERLGLVSAYTKLNQSRTDAKNKLRDLIASEKASVIEINKAQKAFDGYDAKIKKADKAVGDFSKNVGNYKSAFGGVGDLFSAFGFVGGVAGLAALSKGIFETSKELQSLDLALKSVTETEANFAEQQLFLSGISKKYGLEIKDLTKQYTAFYVAAKDKLAGNEIQQIFEDIARSGSTLGLSNEALERSFTAVNQMLSKGTIASEELRGQLAESLPGAVQAMTKAVQKLHPEIKNLTEKGLFEMIKEGKILANEVLPETAKQLALITGADKAEGIDTLAKSTNRLSNEWTELVSSINNTDTSGFGVFVKKVVGGLSTILQFTSLLFKDEEQLSDYFKNLGKVKGMEEYQAIMKNIATTSKENQKATKEELLFRERENIRVNQAIIKAEKEKRASITGGDRALFHLQTKQEEDALVQIGKSGAIIKKIKEDAAAASKTTKTPVVAETEKEKKAREKAAKDALDRAKKLNDDLYNLQKQRLERTIQLNDEVADDEKETDEVRIAALQQSQTKQIELTELTKKHALDSDKFVLADQKLSANEKVRIAEEAANKIVDINQKTADEIEVIRAFDYAKYTKELEDKVSKLNVSMNSELQAENERLASLGDLEALSHKERESATEDHENKVFQIKKRYALESLKLQINNLEAELTANDALPINEQVSAEKRQEIAEKLSKAKLDFSEVLLTTEKSNAETIVLNERQKAEKILEMSSDLTDALESLGNALFERKISNIQDEISKNEEYYNRQIELAGDDENQKELLSKEAEKKREELEKKKRKEQQKQAVFNKASAIAQAGISAALAVLAALSTQPFLPLGPAMAALAGVLGAIQIGAIIATPIPKYKKGRKGGPAEFAYVGDGGVREVIERASGKVEITPATDTLVKLEQDDNVYSSVEHYNRLQRASMMASLKIKGEKVSQFQANETFENSNTEIVNELKRNTKAIEKIKNNVTVNVPKIDISHSVWSSKNKT